MKKTKAGILLLILGLHAGLFFARWHHPQPQPGTVTPLLVTIALTPPVSPPGKDRPSVKQSATPRTTAPPISAVSPPAIAAAETLAPPRPAPLQLDLPRQGPGTPPGRDPVRRALDMALEDPRSNTPRPNLSERFDITLGNYDCVFTERLMDGTIYRGPGIWVFEPDPNMMNPDRIGAPGRGSIRVCKRKPP